MDWKRENREGGAAQPGVTPMMRQYMEIKAANPGMLLFYRMGDFYELFFDDAEIASRALGITLTRRGKHLGEDIPMCGVPVHAADDYLRKLIELGHRVAVCEQMEDPAQARKRGAKSVVRRDVTRLVTPGTITEEKLLDPAEACFLAALSRIAAGENRVEMALAWLDLSTGLFRLCATAESTLPADLARISPRELIIADSVYEIKALRRTIDEAQCALSVQPAAIFDSHAARRRLEAFFAVAALDAFGEFSRAQISAAGALISYVDRTQVGQRAPLRPPVIEDSAAFMFIDQATRASLELVSSLSGSRAGTLLHAIDRTITGAGARLLADRLANPLTDPERIAERLDSIAFLLDDPQLADSLREELKGAPDIQRALSRLALNRGGPRELAALGRGLAAMERMADLLTTRQLPPELADVSAKLRSAPADLAKRLCSTIVDAPPVHMHEGGFIRSGCNAALDELRRLRDESTRIIAQMQADYAAQTGIRSLKIRYNNVLGYFIEAPSAAGEKLAASDNRFIHRQTMANAMRFTTAELAELESRIGSAAEQALKIELELFEELRQSAVQSAAQIGEAAEAAAAADVAQGLAKMAELHDYCRPRVDRSLSFHIEGGRHPVVEQALRRREGTAFVANDCDLGPAEEAEHGAVWLLTGPNMGGKSTFLRQNALIAILAQMGSFVPAAKAHVGVVNRLFSRVGASDDLARGRSTFMVEMIETAAILNQADERSLVILDEIGRGTATYDGLAIAWATIEYLHEVNRCRTLFATHYHELTALAATLGRLVNVTMKVREWQGDVIFLHEVARGAADGSYGIQVARLAGLPPAVIARARAVLDQLENVQRSRPPAAMVDDLPLFASARQEVPAGKPDRLRELLQSISPDELTPRQALEALYDLRAMLYED